MNQRIAMTPIDYRVFFILILCIDISKKYNVIYADSP